MLNFARDFRHQLIQIEFGQHGVSDGDQQAKIVALAAQQVVIVAVVEPGQDLLDGQTHRLGQRLQAR
ncbi:hypothetical protein D3C86_1974940 [compost metagenome]